MSKETLFGITIPLTGAGVVLLALAPLALPFLVLTIAATIPLLLVGLAVGLVVAVVAAPVVGARRLLRRYRGTPSPTRPAGGMLWLRWKRLPGS